MQGRKSSNVAINAQQERPEPPSFLTVTQADIWRRVVADIPADWFASRVQLTMVSQLVRHIDLADKAAHGIEAAGTDADQVEAWAKTQRAETAAILALMRSMRLTNQATQSNRKSLKQVSGKAPHELSDAD